MTSADIPLFTITLIGLVLPTAVALMTDYVFMDDMAVRLSRIFWVASVITWVLSFCVDGLNPNRDGARTLAHGAKNKATRFNII